MCVLKYEKLTVIPHIYSDTIVKDEERSKAKLEKAQIKEGRSSVLGCPKSLPAVIKQSHTGESERGWL
jgi:hypothetical protein